MKNKFSKWDVGGGSRSIVQGLNLFTSRNLFKSLKSILMVVALLSLSSNVWADYTVTFNTASSDGSNTSTKVSDYVNSSSTSYVSSITTSKAYYNGKSGVKLGASSSAGNIVLTLSTTGQVNASSISIVSATYDAGKNFKCTVTYTDNTTADQTFSFGAASASISLNSAKKVKSVKFESLTASKGRGYISSFTFTTSSTYTVYLKNTMNWPSAYVYFYNGSYWDTDKGSGSKNILSGANHMSYDDETGLFSWEESNNTSSTYVCFTKDAQEGYDNFWSTEGIYCNNNFEYDKVLVVASQTSVLKNSNTVKYYTSQEFVSKSDGEGTGFFLPGEFNNWETKGNEMTLVDGTLTYTKDLTANTTYEFKVYNKGKYYGWGTSGSYHTFTASGSKDVYDGDNNLKIQTSIAGTYTFTFNSSTNTVTVTYPAPPVTVTFKNNGVQTSTQQVPSGGTIGTLPTLDASQAPISGYTFMGWVNHTNAWSGFEAEMTQALITGNEVINADVTYDAVWAKAYDDYGLVLQSEEVTTGNYIIDGYVNPNDYAMGNTLTSNKIPGISVIDDGGWITTTNTAIIWRIIVNGSNYAFYNAAINKYLNTVSGNANLVLQNDPAWFTLTRTDDGKGNSLCDFVANSRHLEYYNGNFDTESYKYGSIYIYKQDVSNYFVTPPAQITVTWHIGNGTQTATTYDGTAFSDVDAPEVADDAIGDCVNKFMGWATAEINIDEATAENVAWADETTISNSNKDFYAVFAQAEESTDYTQITSEDDLEAGGRYLIVGNSSSTYKALPVDKAEALTTVSPSSSTISNPAAELVWTLEGSADAWKIKSVSNSKYLQINSGNLTFANSTSLTFSVSVSSSKFTFTSSASSGNKILSYYANGNMFNAFTTANTVYVYKSSTTYSNYATTCPTTATIKTYDGSTLLQTLTDQTLDVAVKPTAPSAKTGYDFVGWNEDQEATTGSTTFTPTIAKEYTLYAIWQAHKHTLTYANTDGATIGNGTAAGQVAYGTALTTPTNVTKPGYDFAGWSDNLPATMPDNDVTITASWTPHTYTATVNQDGGTGITAMTVTYLDDKLVITGTSTKDEFKLTGYLISSTPIADKDGNLLSNVSGYTNADGQWIGTSNPTIKVEWTAITWTDYLTDCSAPDTWFLYIVGETEKSGEMVDFTKTVELEGNRNYGFKLYKNIEGDSENQVWYTDGDGTQNPGTITVDNCTGWNFKNTTPSSGNTGIRTTATGNYTFSFEIVDGYPRVSVTYPTAYQISYEANGGSGTMNPSDYCAAGGTITLATNTFEKTGNHFNGWVANVDVTIGGSPVSAGTLIAGGATIQNINSNITLTAQWQAQTYTITYLDRNGLAFSGTNYDALPKTHTYGEETNIPDATVDDDHVFQGWWWDAACTDDQFTGGVLTGITTNVTLYAKILPKACKDQYSFHWGGSDVRTNNTFACFTWIEGTKHEIANYVIENAADVHKYFVGYNGFFYENDGLGTANAKSYANDVKYIPFEATMANDARPTIGNNATGAIGTLRIYHDSGWDNLYLTFRPNGYGLMYGATGTENKIAFNQISATVWQTAPVELTADMKKTDGSFKYQVGLLKSGDDYTACGHGEAANFGSMGSYCSGWGNDGWGGNLSTYDAGRWGYFEIWIDKVNKNWLCHFTPMYRLHYDLDGGENANIHDEFRSYAQSGTDLNTTVTTEVPVRDGYTFLGWKKGETSVDAGETVAINADNVVITAQWAQNFTVTYEIGGYSSSCSSETTHYCGEENIIVCDNLVVPTGYTFNGWTSNITIGGKTSFKGGDKFTMPCSNVVFTADVTADEYDITYNGLEGASNTNPKKYTIESAFDFVAPGERAGYTFVGWFDAATDGNPVTGITLGSMGIVTVWAHWNANSYSVTLDKNEGDADGTATFVYNTSAPTSYVAATRNGYNLAGYYTTPAAGGQMVLNADGSVADGSLTDWKTEGKWTRANNDGVLYAKWTAKSNISYTVNHYWMDPDGVNYTLKEHSGGTGSTGQDKSSSAQPKTYEGFATPEAQTLILTWPGPCVVDYYYERNKYKLTWEGLEDATVTGEYTQGQVYHGATITYPTSVSKDGYYFKGWDITPAKMPIGATTITAQWAAYENYRTYCGNAVTFVANGGMGEDYVVTVDADKLTHIPTVETAGFTREGYGFAGWMVDGDESKTVYAPDATINPITDGMIVNAVWISIPTINAAVPAITSTNNVGIASAQRTLTVNNPDGLEATIHIAYKKNGEAVEKANSEFRFCNTGGLISENNIVSSATSIATDFTIQYKPNAYNKIDSDYTLYITVTRKGSEAIVSSAEFNLKGRSLPEKFVIAVKNNSEQWLALPANMTGACTPEGMPITVTGEGLEMTADASVAAAYSLTGHSFAKDSAFFTSVYNSKELWASKSSREINNGGTATSDNKLHYEWGLTPTDETLISYNMANKQNGKELKYYDNSKFGMYADGVNTIYFIAVTPREETTAVVDEWYKNKILFHLPFAMKSVSMTINGVAVPDDDITIANRLIKTTGYVLYELGGNIDLVAHSGQVMELTIGDGTTEYVANISIPQIIVAEVASCSALPAKADVVVRDGGHLTIDIVDGVAPKSFNNVTIYPNSKISVPDGKYFNVKSLTFFGGIDEMNGEETNIYAPELSLKGTMKADTLIYRMRVNAEHMMPVSFPYDVTINKIVREDKLDSPSWGKVGTDIRLETYNGELRAEGNRKESDESTWTEIKEGTLTAGIGYTVAAQYRFKSYLYTILDFPMANPYKDAAAEEAVKNAAVQAHDAVNWYDKGWNLMGNPYMAGITGAGAIKVNETDYDFVYIPTADGEDYYQGPLVSAHILPFKDFFVQVNENGTMYFDLTKRVNAPARMLADIERTAQFSISLAGANKTDITYFKVADNFTESYDIPGDNAKMFGSAVNTKVYSLLNGEDQLAQMALNADMTAQPIQLGYIAPENGEYIFALDNTYTDYQNVEHIYLLENGEIKVDLLNAQYTFTTEAKTDNERFAILIVMKGAKMPTDLMDGLFDNDVASPKKVIYNDHFYILNTNRRVYDGTGKYINKMQKNK